MSKKFYLKDWHGKEKEFTDEKIFVRGEDGELIQFTQGTGGGSGGDDGGMPYLIITGSTVTNTNKTDVYTTLSKWILKGATVIRAWKGAACNIGKSYYPVVSSVSPVSLEYLEIDTSATTHDVVKNQHRFATTSSSAYNTLEFRVLFATDIITVKSAGGGLFAGTLNRGDLPFQAYSDRGAYPIMPLKSLEFAEGVTEAPESVCYNQFLLESVDLSGVEKIGNSAFSGCESLKSVSLNPNLTSLGNYAFNNCTSLTGEIVIPNAITKLQGTFAGTKLDRVVFPAGFSQIDTEAFYDCTHPTEFDFSACTSVPYLWSSANLGRVGNGQIIKVPSALFDKWSTASNWSEWAAQMVAV